MAQIYFDWNQVLGENTAARLMLVDKHREFDANYKYQSFEGATLEFLHQLSPNTRLRLHLETGEANRSLIGGTFKVGSTPTGLPNGIVADPKLADLVSEELLEEIINYSDVNYFDGKNYDSIYPTNDNSNYGFIDLDGDGFLGKNFTDTNGNGEWDIASKVIGYIDSDNDGLVTYNGSIKSGGLDWVPIIDNVVPTQIFDDNTGKLVNNSYVGLKVLIQAF